jgi:hypothetical protein
MLFRDILCESRGRILLTAADGARLENIRLDNITVTVPRIEDPAETVPRATSLQLSNGSPRTRAVRAAVVADNVEGLTLRDVVYRWPTGVSVPMHGICCRNVSDLTDASPSLLSSRDGVERILQVE